MAEWPVHDAKRRFSELIERAQTDGPQVITRHGRQRAVVLSAAAFRKLEATKPDFKEYLLSGPKVDDFDVERTDDLGRGRRPLSYLLDTNVVSETRKRRPDPNVIDWLQAVDQAELHISVLTIGELTKGVAQHRQRDPQAAASLEHWLRGIEEMFSDRVVPIDTAVATAWGHLGGNPAAPGHRFTHCRDRVNPWASCRHTKRRRFSRRRGSVL